MPIESHLSRAYAAFGLISTLDDLGGWDNVLRGNMLLSDVTKMMMFSYLYSINVYDPKDHELHYRRDEKGMDHPLDNQEYPQERYGFGIRYRQDKKIGLILWNTGQMIGFNSFIGRYMSS